MKPSSPCCQNPSTLVHVESPFTKIVALGFYDGPTAGVLQCATCKNVYRFDMLDWDANHDVRIFRLASLPANALDQLAAVLQGSDAPRWPVWVPASKRTSSDVERDSIDRRVHDILAGAGAAALLVAWRGWGEYVLAAKKATSGELQDVPDWFSLDEAPTHDWFSELGLVRDVQPTQDEERRRETAMQHFLHQAKANAFCSTGPYPSREELHERR